MKDLSKIKESIAHSKRSLHKLRKSFGDFGKLSKGAESICDELIDIMEQLETFCDGYNEIAGS